MNWEQQTVQGVCEGCELPIYPGEPARLLTKRPGKFCWMCARKRLMETAPANMPSQVAMPARIHVEGSKFVDDNFDGFNRTEIGRVVREAILKKRKGVRENDGRARQVGSE